LFAELVLTQIAMYLVTFLLEVKTSLAFWWDVTIATAELRARYRFSNIRKAEDLGVPTICAGVRRRKQRRDQHMKAFP
jgi:hypothetical protein